MDTSGSTKIKGPVTWESVGLLVLAGGGLVAYFNSLEKDRLQRLQGPCTHNKRAQLPARFLRPASTTPTCENVHTPAYAEIDHVPHAFVYEYITYTETKLGKSVGKPDIGGPFELIDHFGRVCEC